VLRKSRIDADSHRIFQVRKDAIRKRMLFALTFCTGLNYIFFGPTLNAQQAFDFDTINKRTIPTFT